MCIRDRNYSDNNNNNNHNNNNSTVIVVLVLILNNYLTFFGIYYVNTSFYYKIVSKYLFPFINTLLNYIVGQHQTSIESLFIKYIIYKVNFD